MSALQPRRTALAGARLLRTRQRLKVAVERAQAALDALDGDPDLEAACDGDGMGEDREPDLDGDGRPELSRQVAGRDVNLVDGASCSWAERRLLDPDDAPDPLQPPRYGWGCSR